ncbi:CD59 glycoprotein-like [Lepisosteus oculatus]|uniref:CD59 glycoprotein-like n=1 Tax=Lepisosteus oculatus TaxID=7918 RepID=UPI00371B958E
MEMKSQVFLAVVLLALSCGEALRCNNCVAVGRYGSCTTKVETCGYQQDTCITAVFNYPLYGHFRRCIRASDCFMLQSSSYVNARCCTTDLCN